MWVPVKEPIRSVLKHAKYRRFYQVGFDYDSKKDTTQSALTPDLKQMLISSAPGSNRRVPTFII